MPTASSSPARLIPASLSPHHSGLELEQPSWHRQQHQKAAAAAAPPPGSREETSQLLGRDGRPLPAYGTAVRQTQPGCPKQEPVLGCPRQSPGDALGASGPACACVTADTAEAMRPLLPPVPTLSGIPPRAPALLARGLAGCRSKIPPGTCSPTGGGSSHGLAGVSHPALLAHAFGLPLLCPTGSPSAKNSVSLKLHSQQITYFSSGSRPPRHVWDLERLLKSVLSNLSLPQLLQGQGRSHHRLGSF